MPLPLELEKENSQSWFRHFREYNIVRRTIEDQTNLKNKMCVPDVIHAIRGWVTSNDAYCEKKQEYEANKTSEGLELCNQADWYRYFTQNEIFALIEGKPRYRIGNYEEWLIRRKKRMAKEQKKMAKELPEDVLGIIRAYSKPIYPYVKEYNETLRIFGCRQFIQIFGRQFIQPLNLKDKLGDSTIREQLQICVDAIHKSDTTEDHDAFSQTQWWVSISLEKFVALLCEQKYRMRNYAEWVFKDEMEDAWMDDHDYDDSWMNGDNVDYDSDEPWMSNDEL